MTLRQPAVLPPTSYRRAVRPETGGQIAHTHLAVIADEMGVDVRAFVKHFPASSPCGLFNEWFGYCVMSALGIPQPAAAILQAPVGGTGPVGWAFASMTPTPKYEGTPKELYNLASAEHCKELIDRLMSCHAFPSMVAADQACMNGDRNLGNLVFTGKKSFVVIDHGEILGGSNRHRDVLLKPTGWAISKPLMACEHFRPLPTVTSNAIYASAEVVAEKIWDNFAEMRKALKADSNRDTSLALDAVWWRSLQLAPWFKDALQLVL